MVIPRQDIEYIKAGNYTALYHKKAKVQIYIPMNSTTAATQVFVLTLDSLGNTKSSKEFQGHEGFWQATAEFERLIMERLGLEEIVGVEVGDIVQVNADTKTLKKGTYLLVKEVSPLGKITKYDILNNKQVKKASENPLVTPLLKAQGLDFLFGKGIKSLDDIGQQVVKIGLEPNSSYDIPAEYKVGEFEVGGFYDVKKDYGGGQVKIDGMQVTTDPQGGTSITTDIQFEDGAKGKGSLEMLETGKKTPSGNVLDRFLNSIGLDKSEITDEQQIYTILNTYNPEELQKVAEQLGFDNADSLKFALYQVIKNQKDLFLSKVFIPS